MTNPTSSPTGSLDSQLELAAGTMPGAPDIDALWQRGRRTRRNQALAMRGAMLSVVAVIGLAAFSMVNSSGQSVQTAAPGQTHNPAGSLAEQRDAVVDSDRSGPGVGDHWHNAFGISVCGEWRPTLMSTVDEVGIHSHQDGLIHIHPWSAVSAHENARLELFFDAMQLSVSDDQIVFDNGSVLPADISCDGEPSVLRLVRWQFVEFDPNNYTVITSDFGAEKFTNDRAGFALVVGPEDAAIELPPSTSVLAEVSPAISTDEIAVGVAAAEAADEANVLDLLAAAQIMVDFSEAVRAGEETFMTAPVEVRTADTRFQFGISSAPITSGPESADRVPDAVPPALFQDLAWLESVEDAVNAAVADGVLVAVMAVDDAAFEAMTDLDGIGRWAQHQTDSSLLLTLYPDGSRSIESSVLAPEVIKALETGPLVDGPLINAMVDALVATR